MLTIDNERCIQCGECLAECFKGALEVNDDDKVVFVEDKCIWCGHCLAVCPRDCIIIDGDGYDCMDVEDLGYASKPTATQVRNMILIRRSVRRFTDTEVTEDEINKILEAGRYAPTGMNRQENAFMVISDPEKRDQLLEDTVSVFEGSDLKAYSFLSDIAAEYRNNGTDPIYYKAPVVIFIFSDDEVDATFAAANMSLMAQGLQLGVCPARIPACIFLDEKMREKWNAPEGLKCVIALLIGNPEAEYFSSVPRKQPEIVRF